MKYTKEQILEIADKIMKDLRGKFYFEGCIIDMAFSEQETFAGKYKGQIKPQWIVGVKAIFDNEDILMISDEDGEPLYYMNFNTFVYEIAKDEKGYYRVGLPRD